MSARAERKETSSEFKENKTFFKVAKKTLMKEDQELPFETLLKEIPKKLMAMQWFWQKIMKMMLGT